ncbi:unnamed protein product [Lota lota]
MLLLRDRGQCNMCRKEGSHPVEWRTLMGPRQWGQRGLWGPTRALLLAPLLAPLLARLLAHMAVAAGRSAWAALPETCPQDEGLPWGDVLVKALVWMEHWRHCALIPAVALLVGPAVNQRADHRQTARELMHVHVFSELPWVSFPAAAAGQRRALNPGTGMAVSELTSQARS